MKISNEGHHSLLGDIPVSADLGKEIMAEAPNVHQGSMLPPSFRDEEGLHPVC